MPFSRTLLALSCVALLAMAGCGGDDNPPSTTTGSAASSGSALEVEGHKVDDHGSQTVSGDSLSVELDDDYFKPTVIQGKAGSTVTLELENEGSAEHNFTIDGKVAKDVEAGQKAEVKVTFPSSGRLPFYCEYHVAKGMGGALEATQ